MPVGLSEAPGTSMRLMSHVFSPYIGVFVVVYFDDILVYRKSLQDHVTHVRTILQTLQNKHLRKITKMHSFNLALGLFLLAGSTLAVRTLLSTPFLFVSY